MKVFARVNEWKIRTDLTYKKQVETGNRWRSKKKKFKVPGCMKKTSLALKQKKKNKSSWVNEKTSS